MSRSLLIALQAIGALSLLAYPFVLLANVMSIAAPRQTPLGAVPFLALSVYPIVWIVLWIVSWKALGRGAVGLAFGLSSVPIVAMLAVAGLFAYGSFSALKFHEAADDQARKALEPANPLLWTLLRAGTRGSVTGRPAVSPDEAVKAIEARPELVNVTVPGYGSPLNNALMNMSGANFDGSFRGDASGPIRVVRALVAHGARLTPEEQDNLWRGWQLRRALWDGPVTTESENPLVWRIVTRDMNTYESLQIRPEDQPLLNKPTRLHGSPMYALLMTNGFWSFPAFWNAGARLTPDEARDPAVAKALAAMRDKHPDVK